MTTDTTTAPAAPPPAPATAAVIEAPAERDRRLRTGGVMLAFAVIGFVLALFTKGGTATFQLVSGDFTHNLLKLPAKPVGVVLGVLGLGAAAAFLMRRVPARYSGWLGALLGISFIGAFLCWASSGKTFPLANQFQGTLNFATPLILGALAGVLCERAGVINIAIEGQFLVGAFTAAVVASATDNAVAALVAAAASGVVMAWLLAVFSIKYLVNQVVLGVVLVVFASGITGYLFDQFLQDNAASLNTPEVLKAVKVPLLGDIPLIGPILFNQTVLVYLTYTAVVVVTFVLFETRWGLRVRSVGEHPKAADTVGIKVRRVRYQSVLAAGVLAGLGGAFFTVGYAGSFSKDMTAGNGFIALAALIMGRWHPVGAMVAALFFGFATQLQSQLQIIQTPIPGQLLLMAPYLATIVAVAGLVGRVRAPKADGEPYVQG